MRANRPTSSASTSPTWCNQATGSGARNAGDPPGATTARPTRPARRAATADGEAAVGDADADRTVAASPRTAATSCSARRSSPPK